MYMYELYSYVIKIALSVSFSFPTRTRYIFPFRPANKVRAAWKSNVPYHLYLTFSLYRDKRVA